MKTIRFFGMAFMAITLCLGMQSCDNDETKPDNSGDFEIDACTGTTPSGIVAVDLGLTSGTKWANRNVGASTESAYGDYFAWGETSGYGNGKLNFAWSTYTLCNGTKSSMNKYNASDQKTELEPENDAAYINWGADWRMPTMAQMEELKKECTWAWASNGYRVTGPNGNSIFLPAGGCQKGSSLYFAGKYGEYWMRTRASVYVNCANIISFSSSSINTNESVRCEGRPVRPVYAAE